MFTWVGFGKAVGDCGGTFGFTDPLPDQWEYSHKIFIELFIVIQEISIWIFDE